MLQMRSQIYMLETLQGAELKLIGKKFSKSSFLGFSPDVLENIGKFPDYLQTSWPTFQIPDIF